MDTTILHDQFTESYFLQVIDLYRHYVHDDDVHLVICSIANERMRHSAVFKEDLHYCHEVCMQVGIPCDGSGEPPF